MAQRYATQEEADAVRKRLERLGLIRKDDPHGVPHLVERDPHEPPGGYYDSWAYRRNFIK